MYILIEGANPPDSCLEVNAVKADTLKEAQEEMEKQYNEHKSGWFRNGNVYETEAFLSYDEHGIHLAYYWRILNLDEIQNTAV